MFDEIYELILDHLVGETTSKEEEELKQWLKEEAHQKKYIDFCTLWYSGKVGKLGEEKPVEEDWKRVCSKHRQHVQQRIRWTIAAVAACLLAFIGCYYLFSRPEVIHSPQTVAELAASQKQEKVMLVLSSGQKICVGETLKIDDAGASIHSDASRLVYATKDSFSLQPVYNELIIPRGGEYRLKLADGTQVVLNSASSLRFPVQLNTGKREVWLSGEAYFDVTRQEGKPFVVHLQQATVKVLGTSFNVMAYEEEENTEITLVSGRVEVGYAGRQETLFPGHQITVDHVTQEMQNQKVDVFPYIAWKDGVLRFDDLPLKHLMNRLSRWYNITFEFRDKELEEKVFSGGFKRYEDLEQILYMIQQTNDVKFSVQGDKVIIEKK